MNNTLTGPKCKKRNCRYFIGVVEDQENRQKVLCRAFLHGIPDEIAYGNNKHCLPLKSQSNHLVYEKKETKEIISELGIIISFNLPDPVGVDFIANKTIRIRDAYGLRYEERDLPAILKKLSDQLINGYVEGWSLRTVAQQIKDDLSGLVDMNMEQATMIAITEISGAVSYGNYVRIKNSGFKQKEWITAKDEKVRPLHRKMEGKRINIDDLWTFTDGNTLRYPSDDQGPDHLVVGCRCIEVVVPGSNIS